MRRLIWLLLLASSVLAHAQGQGYNSAQTTTFTSTGFAKAIDQKSIISYHEIIWTVTGTVSSCTVSLDSSPDNSTWTVGGIITGQDCHTSSNSGIINAQANFVRVNVSTYVGTGKVVIQYLGWTSNPAGGGGVVPGSPCGGDATHALGWSGSAYTCNAITATASPGGSNTQMQFNDSSALAGSAHLFWTKGTNTLSSDSTTILDFSASTVANLKLPAAFFQTNGSNLTSVAGLNFVASSANAAGLTLASSNPSTNQIRYEVSGTLNQTHGGTNLDTHATTGIPYISSGTWTSMTPTGGYPLTGNSAGPLASPYILDATATVFSGADPCANMLNAFLTVVNSNSSPVVEGGGFIGSTYNCANSFISPLGHGTVHLPPGGGLLNMPIVIGGQTEIEGYSIGYSNAQGSLLTAQTSGWPAGAAANFGAGSFASPPAYAGGTTYNRGSGVASGGVNYYSVFYGNHSGHTPSSSPIYWTLLSSVPSPVVSVYQIATASSDVEADRVWRMGLFCQYTGSTNTPTDGCGGYWNQWGQEGTVLDRVKIQNATVFGLWLDGNAVADSGDYSNGVIGYNNPNSVANQAACKTNGSDTSSQSTAISSIAVSGNIATVTLSLAATYTLWAGSMVDIVGGSAAFSNIPATYTDETSTTHGYWTVYSVVDSSHFLMYVPTGTAACASSCGTANFYPIGINVASQNNTSSTRGIRNWTVNASACTSNTVTSAFPPLAIQLSGGDIPVNNVHTEGWRVGACIGCFSASNGEHISDFFPTTNTYTGLLIDGKFGVTNFDARNIANPSVGGVTGANAYTIVDLVNSVRLTYANNPVVRHYWLDNSSNAYFDGGNCADIVSSSGTAYCRPAGGVWVHYTSGTLDGPAHSVYISEGTAKPAYASPGTLGNCFISNGASSDPTFQSCPGGGFANPMTTAGDLIIGGASGAATRLAGPTGPNSVPQMLVSTPSGGVASSQTYQLAGVPIDTTNPATLLVTDRASYLNWTSGTALALPSIASSGFGSNLPFSLFNNTGSTLTVTPNAGHSDLCDSASTCTILAKFASFFYQDAATNWNRIYFPTFAAFGSTCTGVIQWSTTTGFSCNTAPTLTGTNFTGIPNAGLSNSAITIGGTSVSLGGSTTGFPVPGPIGGTTPAVIDGSTITAHTHFNDQSLTASLPVCSDGSKNLSSTCTGLIPGTALASGGVTHTQTDSTFPTIIASGTAAMGTSAISSGACATVVTVSATGVATTDSIKAGFNGDPTAVTGYGVSATGAVLTIYPYPTANNVNFKVCNSSSGSITPGSLTLNWQVLR